MFVKFNRRNKDGDLENIEYELSTTLRIGLAVQKRFAKPFLKVAQSIRNLGIEELIAFLSCGIEGSENDRKEFRDAILDGDLGLGGIYEAVAALVTGIQYPGLSEDEIEKKVQAQQEKIRSMGIETGSEQLSNEEPLSD